MSVNVGTPAVIAEHDGTRIWSGIGKAPVEPGTALWLSTVNLSGDGQADLSVHGGPEKAVYAYPSEHLAWWATELGEPGLGTPAVPAAFGENLSTIGPSEHDVNIGDRWRWGDAVLEVCQPRWPCFKLALHRHHHDIGTLMRATGRTGWYLRVLEPGEVRTDDEVRIDRVDDAGLSVYDAHLAMGDRHLEHRSLVEALVVHPALAAAWRSPLSDRLDRS